MSIQCSRIRSQSKFTRFSHVFLRPSRNPHEIRRSSLSPGGSNPPSSTTLPKAGSDLSGLGDPGGTPGSAARPRPPLHGSGTRFICLKRVFVREKSEGRAARPHAWSRRRRAQVAVGQGCYRASRSPSLPGLGIGPFGPRSARMADMTATSIAPTATPARKTDRTKDGSENCMVRTPICTPKGRT